MLLCAIAFHLCQYLTDTEKVSIYNGSGVTAKFCLLHSAIAHSRCMLVSFSSFVIAGILNLPVDRASCTFFPHLPSKDRQGRLSIVQSTLQYIGTLPPAPAQPCYMRSYVSSTPLNQPC